jgi:glutamate-1-semialdehyde 2,1-aminomutase
MLVEQFDGAAECSPPSLVVSYSHLDDDIDQTVEAIDGALAVYGMALEDRPEVYLVGRPVQPAFRRRAA